MKCSCLSARRGMTLVELLVIISACSIVFTTSAVLMHRVMHTQKKTRAFFDVERSAVRLSDQFRRDVHQATAATVDADATGEKPFLQLQLPNDRTIEYRHSNGDLLRVESREGTAVSREEFPFPDDADLKIREAESPRRVVLSIATEPNQTRSVGERSSDPHAMPVYLQVEAALHRGPRATGEEVPH